MKIFLYGTLADPVGFGFCAGKPVKAPPVPAVLHGFRRVLLRGARYPTLRRAPREAVPGVVMRVSADMLARLQNYESVRYRRIPVRVRTADGHARAVCFYGDAPTLVEWRVPANNKIMALRSRSF